MIECKLKFKLKSILVFSICLLLLTACNRKQLKDDLEEQNNNVTEQPENTQLELVTNGDINPERQEQSSEDMKSIITDQAMDDNVNDIPVTSIIKPEGSVIIDRFDVPQGYKRLNSEEGSFAYYLQHLPLKPEGSKVTYYDGREKLREVYLAVVDFSLGQRDLQQCADAVIRLRAEYLYAQRRYEEIHFNFVSGFRASFTKWAEGNGINVNGNAVTWKANRNNNSSYESFQKYLDIVYAYASTLSLEKELKKKLLTELEIGDVFIQGGSPGHCVIVVDMAVHERTGEKIFMLAQSYMPAQDIQILIGDHENTPWYSTVIEDILNTPEWTFQVTDLRTW